MSRIQSGDTGNPRQSTGPAAQNHTSRILNVSLPNTAPGSRWDVHLHPPPASTSEDSPATRGISSIHEHTILSEHLSHRDKHNYVDAHGALLAPSLCHPHVHIDKAYLLSHPKYAALQIEHGDFAEAMELTGKAKALFSNDDLIERGQRLIDESVAAGVTHMRAFVELDAGVGTKCLEAGLTLKRKAESEGRCVVQLCAFAQLPLFTASQDDPDGEVIRRLMQEAAREVAVDVLGSTPYVESDDQRMWQNVEWMADLAIDHNKHIDFHLDYNLEPEKETAVYHVLSTLRKKHWTSYNADRTIVLGHCTRLTLFSEADWQDLKREIGGLPVSLVGLPTSDLFMMRTRAQGQTLPGGEVRGTLDIPSLIKDHRLNACIGINNIGNAFTPHGSCDPLTLACEGVGVYQAGTTRDAEVLYECISTRAREAIGLGRRKTAREIEGEEVEVADLSLEVKPGDSDLVLFGAEKERWRNRTSVSDAVYLYDHLRGRRGLLNGRFTV